jgi:hypothetical protein
MKKMQLNCHMTVLEFIVHTMICIVVTSWFNAKHKEELYSCLLINMINKYSQIH